MLRFFHSFDLKLTLRKQTFWIVVPFLMISLACCAPVHPRTDLATEGTTGTKFVTCGDPTGGKIEDPLAGVKATQFSRKQLADKLRQLRDHLIQSRCSTKQARQDASTQREKLWQLQDEIARLKSQLDREERDDSTSQGSDSLALERQNKQLKEQLSDLPSSQTRREGKRVVVTLGERVLYDPGKTKLKSQAKPTLNRIAGVIKRFPNRLVVVEGHGGNPTIQETRCTSSWHFSAARAGSVIQYLVSKSRMDPKRFVTVGFGEYHPLAHKNTAANRQLNRRIEIVIYPPNIPKLGIKQ